MVSGVTTARRTAAAAQARWTGIERPSTVRAYPSPTKGSSSATWVTAKRASGTKSSRTTLRNA